MEQHRILFVCMGNICRSPAAEGVTRALLARRGLADRVVLDSAGTHDYHVGAPPDRRMQQAAARRGYDLSGLRARHVDDADFARFDLLLAMDRDNLRGLMQRCPLPHRGKLRLFLEFAADAPVDEVPDPYYGGADGFEHVLDLVEAAADGLIATLSRQ
jgi:protein-tyrosine phosphatase